MQYTLFWFDSSLHTSKECTQVSDSTSRMDTTFSAAAASNLPCRGWNLICVMPPCDHEAYKCTHNCLQQKIILQTHILNQESKFFIIELLEVCSHLRHSSANTLINTPVPNLTVVITGAQDIFIAWVEIQRPDRSLMACEGPQRITWLHVLAKTI